MTVHHVESTFDWRRHNILYNEVSYSLIPFLNFDWFPPKFNYLTVIYSLFWTVAFETNLTILQECCFSMGKIPECSNLKVTTSGYVYLGVCFWICSIKHFFWFWAIFGNIESHCGRNISMLFIAVLLHVLWLNFGSKSTLFLDEVTGDTGVIYKSGTTASICFSILYFTRWNRSHHGMKPSHVTLF